MEYKYRRLSQDDRSQKKVRRRSRTREKGCKRWGAAKGVSMSIHSIRIHRLSGVEVEIFKIGSNMFGIIVLSPVLKGFYFFLVGSLLFEFFDYFFEISYLS